MRRREGSGENEFRGAMDSICERSKAREEGWKMWRLLSSVKMRVFDG